MRISVSGMEILRMLLFACWTLCRICFGTARTRRPTEESSAKLLPRRGHEVRIEMGFLGDSLALPLLTCARSLTLISQVASLKSILSAGDLVAALFRTPLAFCFPRLLSVRIPIGGRGA